MTIASSSRDQRVHDVFVVGRHSAQSSSQHFFTQKPTCARSSDSCSDRVIWSVLAKRHPRYGQELFDSDHDSTQLLARIDERNERDKTSSTTTRCVRDQERVVDEPERQV